MIAQNDWVQSITTFSDVIKIRQIDIKTNKGEQISKGKKTKITKEEVEDFTQD